MLVHCLGGISRSATIVAAYLMYHDNLTVDEALAYIMKIRNVKPNKYFVDQLREFQVQLAFNQQEQFGLQCKMRLVNEDAKL